MATLEVHDGEGRVSRVEISRDQAVLFGSSPKCDIVLEGPGILPYHGRLRWKSSRYKADAFPDAEYLEINGTKMTSASIRQGDEIAVGPCRIFMLYADDDIPPAKDDATRVQPAPAFTQAPASPRNRSRKREDPPKVRDLPDDDIVPPKDDATRVQPAPDFTQAPPLPRNRGWKREEPVNLKNFEADPSSVEISLEGPISEAWDRTRSQEADQPKERTKARRKLPGFLNFDQDAPGQEKILTSPLVIGLVSSLVILIILGVVLKSIITKTVATRLYQRAIESLDDGDYRNALLRFDQYLASNPSDPKSTSQARVLRALANVRQYTSSTGASWTNALEAEREMLEKVAQEPAYRDSSSDLADEVIRTGEALADRAKATADARTLGEAEAAFTLHARVAGSSAQTHLLRSKLPAKLADARAAVRKGAIRTAALAAMDAAIQAGSSIKVYTARDDLIRQYADLATDREVVARLTRANDLIRRAVRVDTSRRPAETTPLPGPLGPPTSLVLRSSPAARPNPTGTVVFALAEGFALGVDGSTGAPLWQVEVGQSSPFPPQGIPGGAGALVVDARHDELFRLDARTGGLLWRQPLGESVDDPPLLLGNQAILTTPSGKLLVIDIASGELQATVDARMRLSRPAVGDEAGQFLYVMGEQDCLFIFARDPLACVGVEYLGHAKGSIPCAPARLGRFLVIAENHTLTDGRWRVCVLDDQGARVRPVQEVAISGWTWATPATSGSVIWADGDRGRIAAYAVGAYEAKVPFRAIATLAPEAKSTGPAFGYARSENELWLGSGRPGRYDLKPEEGKITRAWALAGAGPSVAPIQLANPLVVMTQQDPERPGVMLWGVDPENGSVRWQTVLGSPWIVDLEISPRSEDLSSLAADGSPVALPRTLLASGGFVEAPLPRAGTLRLPEGPLRRLEAEGLTVLIPPLNERYLLVKARGGEFRRVELPVAFGAAPLLWAGDLLLPGTDGRVYLIDPTTGESRAEPYVPPFDREHKTRWKAALPIDGDAVALVDESGRVRRLTLAKEPRPRLNLTAEAKLEKTLLADPVSTGGAVVVLTNDHRIRSLVARDLSPVGAWPFEAPLATAPSVVSGRAFFADRAGGVVAIGPDGQRLWAATLRGGSSVSPPAILDQSAWFLAKDGSLEGRSLGDGSPLDRVELGIIPSGELLALGGDLVIPVARGTIQLLNLSSPSKEGASTP